MSCASVSELFNHAVSLSSAMQRILLQISNAACLMGPALCQPVCFNFLFAFKLTTILSL